MSLLAESQGGNTEYGTFCGTSNRRLHQVWDEDMIEKRINDDFNGDNSTYLQVRAAAATAQRSAATAMPSVSPVSSLWCVRRCQYFMSALQGSGIYANKVAGWRVCNNPNEPNEACSIEWAQESVALACSTAYTDQDGNKITDGFDLEDAYCQCRHAERTHAARDSRGALPVCFSSVLFSPHGLCCSFR